MSFDIFRILIIIICVVVINLVLKNANKDFTKLIGMMVSVAIMLCAISMLNPIISLIKDLSDKAQINNEYLKIIFKCIAICLLGDFTSQLCKDCGETALSLNAEFISKISILTVSLPMYIDIFNLVLKLW